MRQRERLVLPPEDSVVIRRKTRLKCWTKCGVAIGSGQSLHAASRHQVGFPTHPIQGVTTQPASRFQRSAKCRKGSGIKAWRASNTACRNSRPSKVCSAEENSGFQHLAAAKSTASRQVSITQLKRMIKTPTLFPAQHQKRRIPSRFICAVNV